MSQIAKNISSQRNYGLDLLRILAAFYIVVVHTTGIGGIIGATAPYSYQNYICRLLMIFSMSCVNIFGIISGYVGYREGEKKAPFSGFFILWMTTVFYNLLYIAIFHIFLSGSVNQKDLAIDLFPVTFRRYWYLSAYFVVYFFSPYINKILNHTSDKSLKQLLIFCLLLALIEYIGEPFRLVGGYSAFWLLLLYVIGGIMKKTNIFSQIPSFAAAIGIVIINVGLFYLGIKEEYKTFFIFGFNLDYDYSLVTPFYVATAILHVVLFSKLKINSLAQKMIHFAVPAAFSVYIANTNKILWQNFVLGDFMQGILTSWSHSSPLGIFCKIILFAMAFVFSVVIVDYFRQKLFLLLGIHKWPQQVANLFHKDKIS